MIVTRTATPLLCVALAISCSAPPAPAGPVPLSVSPSRSTALQPVSVEIAGRDFDAHVQTDFGRTKGDVLDAQFTAALTPISGGSPVLLEAVTLTPRRTLSATIPAGIPRGSYDLSVTDPRGREGVLPGAFRVVTTAETVSTFLVDPLEPPRAGVPFAVSLTAVDGQGNGVDGFEGEVTLSDLTSTVTPTSLGPFALGQLQVRVTISALASGDRLTVADSLGHAGSSAPFDVVAGPAVAMLFPESPVVAVAGRCSPPVVLELQDALGHPTPAVDPLAATLQSSRPGLEFFPDAACTSAAPEVTFAPGASRAVFYFRGASAGDVVVRALPETLPNATQTETIVP